MRLRRRALPVLALLPLPALAQSADSYPNRPVRMVVAFPAGGSIDVTARVVAQALQGVLGQPVVVENRSGAGGNVGADFVAKSSPDGYTLFMGSASSLATNAALYRNLPYDPARDFTPVSQVAMQPNVIVVHPSLPVRTVGELIAYARQHPGRVNFGSAGYGTAQHMAGDVFRRMAGIDIVHVPYRGGAPAMNDLIAGQVQLMFETVPTAVEPLRAGLLRPLAVTMPARLTRMPDLPTVAESGLPGYESRGWMGVVGPAGLDRAIVARLHRATVEAIRMPATTARLLDLGLEIVASAPDEFVAFIRREIASYREIVTASGITLLE